MTMLFRIQLDPSTCPRCGGVGMEDRQFAVDMRAYGLPQRRLACARGHTWYLGMPEDIERVPASPHWSASRRRHALVCAHCETPFLGTRRQRYCSPACTRLVDAARAKRSQAARRVLTGEALRLARAIPSPWTRGAARAPFFRQELPRD